MEKHQLKSWDEGLKAISHCLATKGVHTHHFKSVSHFLLPVASQVPYPPGLRNAKLCLGYMTNTMFYTLHSHLQNGHGCLPHKVVYALLE